MDAVRVEGLAKRFGELEAVKGVSFSVREGEIFGFLGPNGAGKTTTINMLCTLARPTGGRAEIAGYDVVTQPAQVRQAIGLVFQDTTLDIDLTAEQNLRFHAYAYGVPREVRERRSREMLELVQLWDRRGGKVRTFSGGMKRRLEIARGLLHHPRVLFLDEPTLGLDPQTRRRIWDHILMLRKQESLTIFLTTHYMAEAEICDRIAIIDDGRIVAIDTPAALKDALGGDVVVLRADDQPGAVRELQERFQVQPQVQDGTVVFAVPKGEEFLPDLIREFSQPLRSVSLRRPTLDDVFLHMTGHEIRDEGASRLDEMRDGAWDRW